MNIQIFFFSGTGNTWWVTTKIVSYLKLQGHKVEVTSIESPEIVDPGNLHKLLVKSDIVGFGYPIYGSDAPKIMLEFISNLPQMAEINNHKPALVYCTELACSGNGSWFLKKRLKKKGFKINWAVHFIMPNNISVPQSPFKFDIPHEILSKFLSKAEKRASKLAQRISSDKKWIQGRNPISKIIGDGQRFFFRLGYKTLTQKWGIDNHLCNKCMRCINICSVGNIEFVNDIIQFSDKCNLCMRCYNFCPVQAITYAERSHIKEKGLPYQGPIVEFRPEILKK